jgi:hypothetical protein
VVGHAGAGSVRTEHGGDEDNGGEEKVSLHIESFVREKILLDYLCGRTQLVYHTIYKMGRKIFSYLTTYEKL